MHLTLEFMLQRAFPTLFADLRRQDAPSPLAYGVEVEDGWYEIVRELSAALAHLQRPDLRYTQIKEKFGLLRVYLSERDDEVDALVGAAVGRSGRTCEDCGTTDGVSTEGLETNGIKTYCAGCRAREIRRGLLRRRRPTARPRSDR